MSFTQNEITEILDVMGESTVIKLDTPFDVELQWGDKETVLSIRRTADNSIVFVTRHEELPHGSLEFHSLEQILHQRIYRRQFIHFE